jgi:hypothetical protein
MLKTFVALALAFVAMTAGAVTVQVYASHPYREIVDRGHVSLHLALWTGGGRPTMRLDCVPPAPFVIPENRIQVDLHAVPANEVTEACHTNVDVDVGRLPAARYAVTVRLLDPQGAVVTQTDTTLEVMPVAGRCNALPMLTPQIIAEHATLQLPDFRQRLATDPAYAARLGNPYVEPGSSYAGNYSAYLDYPPLTNPSESRALLEDSGEFRNVWLNGYACFATPPPDSIATVIEFYHAGLDHYFYSGDAGEIAALDAGAPSGWVRTGGSFQVIAQPGCPDIDVNQPGALGVVYRFYGIPGRGPDSHFFTRDRNECNVVDKSQQWSLEGVPFWAWRALPSGECADPQRQVPLYRAWRPFGGSNHRFSTDRAVIDAMVAQGWIDEGAAMCVRRPGAQ